MLCTTCVIQIPRVNNYFGLERRIAETEETEEAAETFHGYIERTMWVQLPIERAAAMFYFEAQTARRLIHLTKYYKQPQVGKYIASAFAQELRERSEGAFFEDIDCIIPMPIHWRRRWERGYNQAEWIADGISAVTGIPVEKKAVKRSRYTKSQTHLNHAERKANVKDCFQLVEPERLRDRHILLIDDVLTTGATMIALGQEIAKAGGVRVSVLTLAWANSFVCDA